MWLISLIIFISNNYCRPNVGILFPLLLSGLGMNKWPVLTNDIQWEDFKGLLEKDSSFLKIKLRRNNIILFSDLGTAAVIYAALREVSLIEMQSWEMKNLIPSRNCLQTSLEITLPLSNFYLR